MKTSPIKQSPSFGPLKPIQKQSVWDLMLNGPSKETLQANSVFDI